MMFRANDDDGGSVSYPFSNDMFSFPSTQEVRHGLTVLMTGGTEERKMSKVERSEASI